MKKVDYHMHTKYSFDGKNAMEEMIINAIKLGFTEIAFTDHVDYLSLKPQYPPIIDFVKYKKELDYLKDKYSKKINIVFGVEIGIGPHLAKEIKALTSKHGFEFVIGSIHDINFADISRSDFYRGKNKDKVYSDFFDYTRKSIEKIDDFNVLGHLDYIERYGVYGDNSISYSDYREVIDELLKALIEKGKGLEINTSGYRYNLKRVHPQIGILKRYRELGGEIVTIGSDAHNIMFIGSHFNHAFEALKFSGFTAFTVFKEKKPIMVDLR